MKTTKYIAILVTAFVVTSCGTTQPPHATPVNESDLFGQVIDGLRQGRALVREGGGLVQDARRFSNL